MSQSDENSETEKVINEGSEYQDLVTKPVGKEPSRVIVKKLSDLGISKDSEEENDDEGD